MRREGDESLKVAMKDLEDTKSQFKQSETRSLQERQKHSETLKSVQTKALED